MIRRSVIVWCAILVAASANGFIRVVWIIPRVGEALGHVMSTLSLSAIILLVAWASIRWMGPTSAQDALRLGILWLALTVSFEFLAGHFLFGQPWNRLFGEYNLTKGRIWILVLLVTATAPSIAAYARGRLDAQR